ncbi:MAG: hypothetical protein ACP5VP_07820 [Candidatus Limnocylindrales bacterium]
MRTRIWPLGATPVKPGATPVPDRTAAPAPVHVRVLVRPALRPIGERLLVRGWLAITLRRTILSWRPLDPPELAHELAHVRQWQQLGTPRFVVRYAAASWTAARHGGDWYCDNALEREAREAAEAARRAGPG